MNIDDMLLNAIKNNDMIKFLCGEGEYMVETSQYAPEAELTDVGKVLSKGIYKLYRYNDNIEQKFEESLLKMLDMSDFDIYMPIPNEPDVQGEKWAISICFKKRCNYKKFVIKI